MRCRMRGPRSWRPPRSDPGEDPLGLGREVDAGAPPGETNPGPWDPAGSRAACSLSVVVLSCDSAVTIEACLDSLVAQQFTDFDTIVVDDASTDETVALVSHYEDRLRLSVVANGSHNIPRGRNIGLTNSNSDIVAFLDSDDSATPQWTRVIFETFGDRPDLAVIGGPFIPDHRTRTSHAIGLNDATVRQLTARGVMQFSAANCAINQRVLPGPVFDEDFRAAEDLELVSRVQRLFECAYIPAMQILHTSRDSFGKYAKQMYRYGFMKLYFDYCEQSYRWIDFVPLVLILVSVAVGVVIGQWWIAFSIVPFSLLEAVFVVAYQRCRPTVALLTFPAWLTKNVAWSAGIAHGMFSLATHSTTRRWLRAKRAGR